MRTIIFSIIILLRSNFTQARHDQFYFSHHQHHHPHYYQTNEPNDLSLWISEQQVKMFSGYSMRIYAIDNGRVNPLLRDPAFDTLMPIIPPEIMSMNFTWTAGKRKYRYHFDHMMSLDEKVLLAPVISIRPKGRIPPEPKQFSVMLPCSNLTSGIAKFTLGLQITRAKGKFLPGTPLRFTLRKECNLNRGMKSSTLDSTPALLQGGPDPECDKKCLNGGSCTKNKICKCAEGYIGQNCEQALCFPQCMNGGNCSAPAICSCPKGYQGRYCEGGICTEKCLNGGKCVQKDTCQCPKGYYGLRCQLSKCVVPCLNGGKCRGNNVCRCTDGWAGNHCEIGRKIQRSICKKPCKNGFCLSTGVCQCKKGWVGKFCNQRNKRRRNTTKLANVNSKKQN